MGFIFWLWVIGIVYYSFRTLKKQFREAKHSSFETYQSQEPQPAPPEDVSWPEETEFVDTIQDPVCGAYITETTAVQRRVQGIIRYFCCEACADRFEQGLRNVI